ncbi:hypothetical protein [Holzapfeliella sp. JNUCC 72]
MKLDKNTIELIKSLKIKVNLMADDEVTQEYKKDPQTIKPSEFAGDIAEGFGILSNKLKKYEK